MPVNQNLSNFSDLAFQTAFIVYAVALLFSLIYYGKMQGVIDARRARTAQTQGQAQEQTQASKRSRQLVAAGAGSEGASGVSGATVAPDADAADTTTTSAAATSAASASEADAAAKRERSAEKFGGMTQSLIWLGIALHLAAIVLRGLATSRFPFGNLYEYVLMVTGGAMVVATITLQRKEWRTLWPWLLVPLMALMFYGSTKLYAESAPVVPALQSRWLPIHVTIVSLGASIGIVSGVGSVLQLLRENQPKGKEHGPLAWLAKPLPSAKKLDQMAYRTAVVTLPMLGLGIVLGAIWAESAWGRFWGWDPKETVAFASWILYAAYLHSRATPSWRKAAPWINVLALATMIFNLFFINMVVSGLHSYAGLN